MFLPQESKKLKVTVKPTIQATEEAKTAAPVEPPAAKKPVKLSKIVLEADTVGVEEPVKEEKKEDVEEEEETYVLPPAKKKVQFAEKAEEKEDKETITKKEKEKKDA